MTDLTLCLKQFDEWWENEHTGLKNEFTQALAWLTWQAAWNCYSREDKPTRSHDVDKFYPDDEPPKGADND